MNLQFQSIQLVSGRGYNCMCRIQRRRVTSLSFDVNNAQSKPVVEDLSEVNKEAVVRLRVGHQKQIHLCKSEELQRLFWQKILSA